MSGSRTSFSTDWDPTESPPDSTGEETIEEVASRVLFSTSLDQKLRGFTLKEGDELGPIESVSHRQLVPGRPDCLHFAAEGTARPALPAAPALVNEKSRGVLLHFFANHELLAAELMALALLRFPDSPQAFRKGLAHTLREEQRHTHWYIQRMKQCGIEFGHYPVNRFFWDAVSSMEEPIDYVSRLSLTFEQANLDYANHFSGLLAEAGDSTSASLLARIYRDEIAHVGYGLRWFRKWKQQQDSDWEALEKRLHFPLSPSRAKGNRTLFNEEGRREAGLDEDYIRKLSLFERSNGRTPNVFFFNPETENRVAALPRPYHPNKQVLALLEDLEFLCAFLARRDDVAVLRNLPSDKHIINLRKAGFVLPELEALEEGKLAATSLLRERKIHIFLPWSKAPGLEAAFVPFAKSANHQPLLKWQDSDRSLFSKQEQASYFSEWFGESYSIDSTNALRSALDSLSENDISELVWKRNIGNAGAGMKRLSVDDLEELLAQSSSPNLDREGGFLLEPFHERCFDFSLQFQRRKGKIEFLGAVEQIVNPAGGYRGSIAMPKFAQGLDSEFARYLMTKALPVYSDDSPLMHDLGRWCDRFDYQGPFGIDSYLYRDKSGKLSHRPACEINFRHTMGRVALELRRQIAPGYGLRFEIQKRQDLAPIPPVSVDQLEKGKIARGTILLTEALSSTQLIATATIAKKRASLQCST